MKHLDYNSIRFNLSKQRILLIKQKIKARDKKKKKEYEKLSIASVPTISELKVIPKNEITYNSMFSRNPFDKKNIDTFNFTKHKLNIELSNRNMQKNRIEYVVRQVALHHIKPSSRLHLNDSDLVKELQKKIGKNAKKIKTKHTKHIVNQLSSITNSILPNYIKIENNMYIEDKKILNTHLNTDLNTNISHLQNRETQIETKSNKRSQSSFPFRVHTMTNETVSPSTKLKLARTRRNSIFFQPEIKSVVVHKPIYTKHIDEFVKEYQKLKTQLDKENKSNND